MKGVMFQMGASATALLGLALSTGTGSVNGFIPSPPPVGGARSSAFLQGPMHVQTVSSLADGSPRAKATTLMSFKQSEARAGGSAGLPRWILPGAAREGLGRRLSFLRRAAEGSDSDGEDEEDDNYEDGDMEEYRDRDDDGLDRNVAKQLKRHATVFRQVSWLSWWCQTILSTVAFIILLFSNAVTNRSARGNILGNGVAFALASLACSGASICWTWGYTLKAKGWRRLGGMAEVDDAQLRMRNSLKLGLYINVAGMLLALIGAEQIVGTLVAKVLYSQGFQPSVMVGSAAAAEVAQAQFRALDVFIVQANTNTLLSHFCSLATSLWLLARTPKLKQLAKGIF